MLLQLGNGATGRGDLLLRGVREGVSLHVHRDRDLTGAQHLDRLVLADSTLGDQRLDGDVATLGEQLTQPVQVDDLVGRLEQRVGEALQLRQTPLRSEERRVGKEGTSRWQRYQY